MCQHWRSLAFGQAFHSPPITPLSGTPLVSPRGRLGRLVGDRALVTRVRDWLVTENNSNGLKMLMFALAVNDFQSA